MIMAGCVAMGDLDLLGAGCCQAEGFARRRDHLLLLVAGANLHWSGWLSNGMQRHSTEPSKWSLGRRTGHRTT
jgi:hypothetical protein